MLTDIVQIVLGGKILVLAIRRHHAEVPLVEVQLTIFNRSQKTSLNITQRFNHIQIFGENLLLGEVDGKSSEIKAFLYHLFYLLNLLFGSWLTPATGNGNIRMDSLSAENLCHHLCQVSCPDYSLGYVRNLLDDTEYVSY